MGPLYLFKLLSHHALLMRITGSLKEARDKFVWWAVGCWITRILV